LTGSNYKLCGLESSDFEAGLKELLIWEVNYLLDRAIVPEQVQVLMNGNTTSQGFNEIVTVNLQAHEIIQMFS
jgi:hypothetical protein